MKQQMMISVHSAMIAKMNLSSIKNTFLSNVQQEWTAQVSIRIKRYERELIEHTNRFERAIRNEFNERRVLQQRIDNYLRRWSASLLQSSRELNFELDLLSHSFKVDLDRAFAEPGA